MAKKPIISIDLDDSKFRKFEELFEKWKIGVEKMPESWKNLNEQIAQTAKLQIATGVSADKAWANARSVVAATKDEIKEAADATGGLATAFRTARISLFGFSQAAATGHVSMAKMAGSAQDMAEGVFGAATGIKALQGVMKFLGPVGVGVGVAGAALGALGDLALDRARAVTDTARTAYGANLGYGQYQAATSALSPFVSNPGAGLQNIAAAQWNPAAAGYLSAEGARQGQNSAQAYGSILRSGVSLLRRTHNLALLQAMGYESTTGLGDNDWISLANQSPKGLSAAIANMTNKAQIARQNIGQGTISSDQQVVASWNASMNAVSAHIASAVAGFNAGVMSFGNWVAALTGKLPGTLPGTPSGGTPGGAGGGVSGSDQSAGIIPGSRKWLGDYLNNPGNIMSGGTLAHYATRRQGYQALASLLRRNYAGLTVAQMISKYAPASAGNDTSSYISDVTKWTGLGANQVPDLKNRQTLDKVMAAIIRQEGETWGAGATPSGVDRMLYGGGNAASAYVYQPQRSGPPVKIVIQNQTGARVSVQANAAGVGG